MESVQSTGVIEEELAEGSLEMEREAYRQVAREGNEAAKRASELMNLVGYEGAGKGDEVDAEGEKDEVGEVQEGEKNRVAEVPEKAEEKKGEGEKTKEGNPAEVGEKREREAEGGTDAGVTVEEEAGKEKKKPKTTQSKDTEQKGKKKRGRPAKAKAKTTPESTEGKKRPVGRPRKGSTAVVKDVVSMEDSGDPAHHTRSKDVHI
jgi:hypothetical protein